MNNTDAQNKAIHAGAKTMALKGKNSEKGYADEHHRLFFPEMGKRAYHKMGITNIKRATKEWGLEK